MDENRESRLCVWAFTVDNDRRTEKDRKRKLTNWAKKKTKKNLEKRENNGAGRSQTTNCKLFLVQPPFQLQDPVRLYSAPLRENVPRSSSHPSGPHPLPQMDGWMNRQGNNKLFINRRQEETNFQKFDRERQSWWYMTFFSSFFQKEARIRSKECSASSAIIPPRFSHDNTIYPTIKSCYLIIGDIWSRPRRWCRHSSLLSFMFRAVSFWCQAILDRYSIYRLDSIRFFPFPLESKCLRSNSYIQAAGMHESFANHGGDISFALSTVVDRAFEILHKLGSTPNPLGSKGCNITTPSPPPAPQKNVWKRSASSRTTTW